MPNPGAPLASGNRDVDRRALELRDSERRPVAKYLDGGREHRLDRAGTDGIHLDLDVLGEAIPCKAPRA